MGTDEVLMGTDGVQLTNMINSGTNTWCVVKRNGDNWQVCARSNSTTMATCDMTCF
jgi:hypothetical protein